MSDAKRVSKNDIQGGEMSIKTMRQVLKTLCFLTPSSVKDSYAIEVAVKILRDAIDEAEFSGPPPPPNPPPPRQIREGVCVVSSTPAPWIGLNDKDRQAIEDECEMMIGKPAFDAIEKKLKELNT